MNKCYSLDGESFSYTELGEVFDTLVGSGDMITGTVYYEADRVDFDFEQFISGENVLELIDDQIVDEIGADYYDYDLASLSPEIIKEFDTLLKKFVSEHIGKSRYYQFSNIKECMVLPEDVIQYQEY